MGYQGSDGLNTSNPAEAGDLRGMLGDELQAKEGQASGRQGYYQSVLSGGKAPENIGGLAINSPDISKISIPADRTGFNANDMSGHELGFQSSPMGYIESPGKHAFGD